MCLSMVYMNTANKKEIVMKDVARLEAEGHGFWLISLFGEKQFVEGTVKTIDLLDDHFIELENSADV